MDKDYEIKKKFLIPEFYVHKTAYCKKCNEALVFTGVQLTSNPPQNLMQCPKCSITVGITEDELQGEWKWREI